MKLITISNVLLSIEFNISPFQMIKIDSGWPASTWSVINTDTQSRSWTFDLVRSINEVSCSRFNTPSSKLWDGLDFLSRYRIMAMSWQH